MDAAAVLRALVGQVTHFARDKVGCRVVQKALDCASPQHAHALAMEMVGSVKQAVRCPNGNFVIQKIVTTLPVECVEFVAEELFGKAADVAKHRYGCRVASRIVERRGELLRPCILANAQGRSSSYVVASAFECCDEVDQHTLVMDLLEHLPILTQSLSGCHVIKALLAVAGSQLPEAGRRLQEVAAELSSTRHGRRIIQDFSLAS